MEQTQGYIETPFFASLKNWFYDLVRGDPLTPKSKSKSRQANMAKAIREKSYKVRMSLAEVETLKEANVLNIAKFLRDSALNAVNKKEQKNFYSKIDREFLLELSRIGNNINQVAKALNTDIAKGEPFDAVRLFYLLIAINENLEALRRDLK